MIFLSSGDKLDTKVEINVPLVEQLVEFDGWNNRTFRLGANMSVRLPSSEWYSEQVKKE
ncbi:uncharacterized protein METZ01_LOCUS235616 [marine metagenome]|uniref:Uncharacterized protein n=1 Tax=marine metagenome TaxID=408172 RepID=A0A382H6E1_9ZZZZ